jgi:hypothetical protein
VVWAAAAFGMTGLDFETAVRNTGEVAELVAKSSGEALDILRQRIREGMEETLTLTRLGVTGSRAHRGCEVG